MNTWGVLISTAIDDIQLLARMPVIKAEPVFVRSRRHGFCAAAPEQRHEQKQENE